MSVSDNKALVLRYYEVFNRHDLAASDACFHPSYRESAHRFHVACFAASPDIRSNLVEMVAEGDLVMDHWTSQGSFIGQVRELDLTGQKLTWQGAATYRFAEGLIVDMQLFSTLREAVAQQLEANKAVVRRYIEEVVNQGHLERIPEFVAASYVEEKRQDEIAVHRAFPDVHFSIEQMAAGGDLVMKRDTVTGTHQGEIGGFAPTGQKLSFSEITVDRVVDGKIAQWWGENNVLEVLQKAAAQKKVG